MFILEVLPTGQKVVPPSTRKQVLPSPKPPTAVKPGEGGGVTEGRTVAEAPTNGQVPEGAFVDTFTQSPEAKVLLNVASFKFEDLKGLDKTTNQILIGKLLEDAANNKALFAMYKETLKIDQRQAESLRLGYLRQQASSPSADKALSGLSDLAANAETPEIRQAAGGLISIAADNTRKKAIELAKMGRNDFASQILSALRLFVTPSSSTQRGFDSTGFSTESEGITGKEGFSIDPVTGEKIDITKPVIIEDEDFDFSLDTSSQVITEATDLLEDTSREADMIAGDKLSRDMKVSDVREELAKIDMQISQARADDNMELVASLERRKSELSQSIIGSN